MRNLLILILKGIVRFSVVNNGSVRKAKANSPLGEITKSGRKYAPSKNKGSR